MEETMKSDEILADLLTKWNHCPMEDVLHIGDSYPCDNVPQPKSCKHCLIDWARNKAEKSEEMRDPCKGCASAFGCRDCRYEGSESYQRKWDKSLGIPTEESDRNPIKYTNPEDA